MITTLEEATDDLRRANAELTQMNAALDGFTYAASHDLQEPLRTLVAFSQLLEKDLGENPDPRVQSDLTHIKNAALRMQGLIKDLLELARKHDHELKLLPVSVSRCVDGALEDLTAAISERSVVIDRDELPAEVRGDRTLLTQVYQNLLSNAIKFVPVDRQPLIRLTARRSGSWWELGVLDNGIGIDRGFHETVFLPFKRLGTVRGVTGSGVGLTLCRKSVTLLGGKVWLEPGPERGPVRGTHALFTVAPV